MGSSAQCCPTGTAADRRHVIDRPGVYAAVIDSNIMIDFLAGRPEARAVIANIANRHVIVVARAEVLAGTYSAASRAGAVSLFSQCRMIEVGVEIADIAAGFRQATRLKLPDALIAATAAHLGLPLITRGLYIRNRSVRIPWPHRLAGAGRRGAIAAAVAPHILLGDG
jgi:predicted nucleic acid-binding protein